MPLAARSSARYSARPGPPGRGGIIAADAAGAVETWNRAGFNRPAHLAATSTKAAWRESAGGGSAKHEEKYAVNTANKINSAGRRNQHELIQFICRPHHPLAQN
jgi:hypothetical protein